MSTSFAVRSFVVVSPSGTGHRTDLSGRGGGNATVVHSRKMGLVTSDNSGPSPVAGAVAGTVCDKDGVLVSLGSAGPTITIMTTGLVLTPSGPDVENLLVVPVFGVTGNKNAPPGTTAGRALGVSHNCPSKIKPFDPSVPPLGCCRALTSIVVSTLATLSASSPARLSAHNGSAVPGELSTGTGVAGVGTHVPPNCSSTFMGSYYVSNNAPRPNSVGTDDTIKPRNGAGGSNGIIKVASVIGGP